MLTRTQVTKKTRGPASDEVSRKPTRSAVATGPDAKVFDEIFEGSAAAMQATIDQYAPRVA